MKFCKKAFQKHADRNIKKILLSHIDALEGKEVIFKEGYTVGEIPFYEIDGESFYLYPVLKEWCTEDEQMTLF
ncbi:hypothetical protein [Bacillus sp. J33]|uniref:hypothetical protein n=1 Tax=Bacillus sp. J33 TaxID=935836 RepID=UPI0004795E28|nr:hypothetical protein [Bacillus sp. J33]